MDGQSEVLLDLQESSWTNPTSKYKSLLPFFTTSFNPNVSAILRVSASSCAEKSGLDDSEESEESDEEVDFFLDFFVSFLVTFFLSRLFLGLSFFDFAMAHPLLSKDSTERHAVQGKQTRRKTLWISDKQ